MDARLCFSMLCNATLAAVGLCCFCVIELHVERILMRVVCMRVATSRGQLFALIGGPLPLPGRCLYLWPAPTVVAVSWNALQF
jgi:hypothetical protein